MYNQLGLGLKGRSVLYKSFIYEDFNKALFKTNVIEHVLYSTKEFAITTSENAVSNLVKDFPFRGMIKSPDAVQ